MAMITLIIHPLCRMSDAAAAIAVSSISVVVVVAAAVVVDSGIVTHRPRSMRIKTLGMLDTVVVNGESSSTEEEEEEVD